MKKIFIIVSTAFAAIVILFFAVDLTPKHAESCAFCDRQLIEAQTFYQGNEVIGMTTHKPAVKGHVLIIPIRHAERFEELTSSEIAEIGEAIKKVDTAVRNVYGTTGYLLIQKNGREAGQSVPHVHFHYLPCLEGDSQALLAVKFFLSPWLKALSQEEMKPEITLLAQEIEGMAEAL